MISKTQFIFPGKMLIQGDPVDLLNVIHYFSYSISTARSQRLMKHYSSYIKYKPQPKYKGGHGATYFSKIKNQKQITPCYLLQETKVLIKPFS